VIARTLARLAVVIGLALIAAAFTPPAPPPAAEPVHRRPATEAEDRRWQLDRLSELIDEHRARQQ
jgi:hypothetical protein